MVLAAAGGLSMADSTQPPVHSPNGAALLPQRLLQIAVALVVAATVTTQLPELGLDFLVLPLAVMKGAKLIVAIGVILGITSQGLRKPGTVADPAPSGSNVQPPLVGQPPEVKP